MIGIVTAMGGEVESDRQPFLSLGQVSAIEGVAFSGSGKTGVLANGPRPAGVHRRIRPPHKRRHAGIADELFQAFGVIGRISALNGNALGAKICFWSRLWNISLGENIARAQIVAHNSTPSFFSMSAKTW